MIRFAFALPLLAAWIAITTSARAQPFRQDINRWVAQDKLAAPATGSILFTGSSSIRRWEQLAHDFADYHIIQRGFGGSQFEQLNGYVNNIVLPYQPAAIVVWEGTNDINSGENGNEVVQDYRTFVNLVRASLPEVEIFWLGIMPTPGRFANEAENTSANTQIAAIAVTDPKLHYVDLPSAFNALNPPTNEAFTSKFVDPIHLSREGYELWTRVVRPQIAAVIAPNKVYAPNPKTLKPGERLLFDFGPSNPEDGDPTAKPNASPLTWNNWHAAEENEAVNAGERITNLVDVSGSATGINLTITGGFATNGKLQRGLLTPDKKQLAHRAVAIATQDYFFSSADGRQGGGNDDRPGGFMLDGLDPNLTYNFRFFGSRRANQISETEYRVTGANSLAETLQTTGQNVGTNGTGDGNNSHFAEVRGIRPDRFGQVFIDITLVQGSFAYLSAMEVIASVSET